VAAPSQQALRLARRLRDLRESRWPESTLTQVQLAKALGREGRVAAATLSSWESPTNPKLPPPAKLRSYALFFSTERSMESEPHLLSERDLTDEERTEYNKLELELLELHEAVRSPGSPEAPPQRVVAQYIWEFHDIGRVTIICPEAPESTRPILASDREPNYTRMYRYADLDALIELYGHIRAANPEHGVFHRLPSEVVADDLSGHLVLLGGTGWNNVTRRLLKTLNQVPVSQVEAEEVSSGEIFRATGPGGGEFFPTWEETEKGRELVEDVAFLARVRNPFNSSRTLTLCNGIHSRGVLGAVRCLTDAVVRDNNENYLATRFPEGSFAMLMRVPVLQGEAVSPDLENPDVRLFEWPAADGSDDR
jgi:hypothetical protein